jgi:hypothetical protein
MPKSKDLGLERGSNPKASTNRRTQTQNDPQEKLLPHDAEGLGASGQKSTRGSIIVNIALHNQLI